MRKSLFFVILFITGSSFVFGQDYKTEIKKYQEKLNEEYKDPEESPLSEEDRLNFKEHKFFSIDSTYSVQAKFVRTADAIPFKMKTSSESTPTYEKYGTATFTLEGKEYTLSIYQSHRLRKMEEYKDYLFLPFTDKTNGKTTYGAGRYLEANMPTGDRIIIDFNKAYNPYCAYADGYACPIPPFENHLPIEIKAGIKFKKNK